jgi:peptidoglycan/LPS O-acetylase OafA/YrhL
MHRVPERVPVRHLRALDGLRGIAVLLVVLPHAQLTGTLPGPDIVQRLTHDFGHGVEIFFILSGFGLTLPILTSIGGGDAPQLNLITYAFNRVYRIVPLFYIAFVLTVLLNAAYVRFWHDLPPTLSLPHGALQVLSQIFFLDRSAQLVDAGFWSIPVQLRWYLLFPLFLMLYVRSRRAFIAVLAAVVVAYNLTQLRSIDIGALPLFLLGMLAADLYVRDHPLQKFGFALAAVGALIGHISDRWSSAPDQFGHEVMWTMQPTTFGWQIAAFGLVLAAASSARFRWLLSTPPLMWLGAASFSIYLIHQPFVEIGARIFGPHGGLISSALGLAAGGVLWIAAELPLTAPALRRQIRARATPVIEAALTSLAIPHVLWPRGDPTFETPPILTAERSAP